MFARKHARGVPPWPVIAAAFGAALLHALPFLRTRLFAPPPGMAWLPAPFVPKDWMAYLAFIRQTPRAGELFLGNPFTTEPQGGRFVLLFHQALNAIHRVTGIDPAWLLELARTAAIVAFAALLWRFLEGVLESERTRAWAVVLVLLSGGLGFAGVWAAPLLPAQVTPIVQQDLWSMYGWTTFEALYNPLWATGLALLLAALRPLLRPGGPSSRGEVIVAALAFLGLWLTHVYSAIALLAIVAAALGCEALAAGGIERRRAGRIGVAVVPALAVAAAIVAWQLQDDVFRRASGGLLGGQAVPVSWYPLTFAATGAFALVGIATWFEERHPWRWALGGWIVGIALLHSSDVLNGYHFLPYAYAPVAILGAGPVERAFGRLRSAGWAGLAGAALLTALLFASPVVTAAQAVADVAAFGVTEDGDAALRALGRLPPGNVLCEASLGNVVPALGPHRTFVGHWFMTPDFEARSERAERAMRPGAVDDLRRLVEEERIDYLIAPTVFAFGVASALSDHSPIVEAHGDLSLVRLGGR